MKPTKVTLIDVSKGKCCAICYAYFTRDGFSQFQHGELTICRQCAKANLERGQTVCSVPLGPSIIVEIKISDCNTLDYRNR